MDTKLDFPLQDGSTKRKHLESIVKQSGETLEELEVPEMHPSLLRVKYIFDSLASGRTFTSGSPSMISNADIYYWGKLNHSTLSSWHISTIKTLDIIQVNTLVKCIKERK